MNYNIIRRKSNKFLQQKRIRDGPDIIELEENEKNRNRNRNKSLRNKKKH